MSAMPRRDPNAPAAPEGPVHHPLGIDFSKHPGFGESLIPVWGPMREAFADVHDGNYAMAALDGAFAVADLDPAESLSRLAVNEVKDSFARGLTRNGIQLPASMTWDAVRKRFRKVGGVENAPFLKPGLEGHHVFVPQGGWGKAVPDAIKNRRWNIKPLEKETHRRIHTSFGGKPRFNAAERVWHGSPTGLKSGAAVVTEHAGVSLARDHGGGKHGRR